MIIEIAKTDFKAIKQYKEQPVYFFRYNLIETEDDTIRCEESTIFIEDVTYDKLVSACIGVKYTIDAQLALLYNYQQDQLAYQDQMNEYQAWRTYCKDACNWLKENDNGTN